MTNQQDWNRERVKNNRPTHQQMTNNDWKAEREAIRARLEAIKDELWERETDGQYIPEERKHYLQQWVMNGDGKRVFDADNSDDVWLVHDDEGIEYDLNAHARLDLAAHAPEDLRTLLSHAEEDEREIQSLRQQLAGRQCPQCAGGQFKDGRCVECAERDLHCEQIEAELALREQRIGELENEIFNLKVLLASESQGRASTPQERAQYIRDVARIREEVWEQAIAIASQPINTLGWGSASGGVAQKVIVDSLRNAQAVVLEAARQSREDKS